MKKIISLALVLFVSLQPWDISVESKIVILDLTTYLILGTGILGFIILALTPDISTINE